MQRNAFMFKIKNCIKQTLAYFLAFGFLISTFSLAGICFDNEHAHAYAGEHATCPYTGPGTRSETSLSALLYQMSYTTGKTTYYSSEELYNVGDTHSWNSSSTSDVVVISIGCAYQTCPYCGYVSDTVGYVDSSSEYFYKIEVLTSALRTQTTGSGANTSVKVIGRAFSIKILEVMTRKDFMAENFPDYKCVTDTMPSHIYATPHTCSDACREKVHTHAATWDETKYTYTCTNTTVVTTTLTTALSTSELTCGATSGTRYDYTYRCSLCSLVLRTGYKLYCNKSGCTKHTNTIIYSGELPTSHVYQHQGIRGTCTTSGRYTTGNENSTSYSNCETCGTVTSQETFSHLTAQNTTVTTPNGTQTVTYYTPTYKSVAYYGTPHYYYYKENLSDTCYTYAAPHCSSSLKQVYSTEKVTCKKGTCNAKITKKIYKFQCTDCNGVIYEYRTYNNCSTCGNIVLKDDYYFYDGLSYSRQSLAKVYATYTSYESETANNARDTSNPTKVLHRTITMTCSKAELGNKICDKVVTKLIPLETSQTLTAGKLINSKAYAVFMDGHAELVDCAYSGYSATNYNVWQNVTLSYGEYSSTGSKTPQTVVIKVYMERSNFDLAAKMESGINGSTSGTGSYSAGVEITVGATTVPATGGYTFDGWHDGTQIVSKDINYTFAMPSKNLTLTAMFTPISYKLNVKSEYESMGTVTATVGGTAATEAPYNSTVKVSATAKTGFTFEGWYEGTERVSTSATYTFTMPAHEVTLLAKFTTGQYTATLNPNGGTFPDGTTANKKVSVAYLGTYGNLPMPKRSGYVFAGWTYNNNIISANSPVTHNGNHTLIAKWEQAVPEFILVTYGHLYGDNSWSSDAGNVGTLGLTEGNLGAALPLPYKTGYSFVNWFSKEDEVTGFVEDVTDNTYVVTKDNLMDRAEDHRLYAGWVENQYTLSFDSNGGTACADMLISYDRIYGYHESLPTPEKDGYSFAGWYVSETGNNGAGAQITDNTKVTRAENHTLYAKWSWDAVKVTVTFDGRTREQIGLTEAESKAMGYGSTIGTVAPDMAKRTVTYPGTYGGHAITACYCTASTHASLKDFGGKHYVIDLISQSTELPTPVRTGYTFKNWVYGGRTITKTTELSVSFGHTVFATYTPKTYSITLDGRGATEQTQNKVTMTFDAKCPDIAVPMKTGYTFLGYYTGVKGSGKMYYNAEGTGTALWSEEEVNDSVTKLYAFWKQNDVTLPEEEDYPSAEPLPDKTITGNVGRNDGKALLYADDYNATTGALTDLQPYLTYDTPGGEGVIPGTELLSFRAKTGAWMLSYRFKRHSGTDMAKITVTVPYRTQYEKSSDETLVISEQKTASYTFDVPKVWSYWTVEEQGLYYPTSVMVRNEALKDGFFTVPVEGMEDGAEIPDCDTTHYGGKSEHVKWESGEINADGTVMMEVELTEEQYIISDIPDTEPDAEAVLKVICKNTAYKNTDGLKVRSDSYTFNGMEILSGAWSTGANGDAPDTESIPENASFVPLTEYTQTYRSGISMEETKPNGFYETTAFITYTGDESNIGTPETMEVELEDINGIRIHTPVACTGVVVDGLEKNEEEESSYTLTLKEALNFFTLRIDNTGTHRLSLGYGTKDFSHALSGKSNVAEVNGNLQNRVKFPFDVYVDVGNDTLQPDGTYDTRGDYLIEAGMWISTSVEQKFYVPVTIKNGEYAICFQSVAVNVPKEENSMLWNHEIIQSRTNKDSDKYVAEDILKLEIKSFLKEFNYMETDDPRASKKLLEGNSDLILKKGYNFSYELQTQGEFYGNYAEILVEPRFYWEKEIGATWQEVKLYRLEEFLYNQYRICYPWKEQLLLKYDNHDVIRQSFTGRGRIPADILCVDADFNLEEYCRWETLTGEEEFLLNDGFLVIQLEIKVKSNNQCWYTWEDFSATTIRYDLSKSVADDFEVGGVE